MNIVKSSFHPKCDLKDKNNYKPYYRILRDGTVLERILLDVPNIELREELICLHFLKNHVKVFWKEDLGFNFVSRDKPWDFGIELSNRKTFNVEITSIAENAGLFEKIKREERLVNASIEKEIPFHELKKLNRLFPSEKITTLIKELESVNTSKKDMLENPYFGINTNIFLSNAHYDNEPIQNLIKAAIESKEAKNHSEKENTLLVIDNRTLTYEYEDLHKATAELNEFYNSCSFKEIWFYTGYCTNDDGNYAEFSLAPLKISENKWKILFENQKGSPPDKDGIMYV
jgi:hypothetical protein